MNPSHLHLLLNHYPIIGTVLGFLVLVTGFLLKNSQVKNVAFGLFIFIALASIPAFLTGEPAEEAIEKLPGVEKSLIHEHEEGAEFAIWLLELLGVVSVVALFFSLKNKPLHRQVAIATLVLSVVVCATVIRVGNTGGEIRHPEIRKSSVNVNNEGVIQNEEKGDDNKD